MAYVKYSEERDIYEMSFANRVAADETISTPVLEVQHGVLDEWVDVTSDLVGVVVVVGSTVQFTLKEGTVETQPAGIYRVRVKVTTSQQRELVGVADLNMKE